MAERNHEESNENFLDACTAHHILQAFWFGSGKSTANMAMAKVLFSMWGRERWMIECRAAELGDFIPWLCAS